MPVRITDSPVAYPEREIAVPLVPDEPRERGVYLMPDPLSPDRTIIEIWGSGGECISISSIQNERAQRFTQALCQRFLDAMDPPLPYLRLVSA